MAHFNITPSPVVSHTDPQNLSTEPYILMIPQTIVLKYSCAAAYQGTDV
jgi:hypothetical protein